MRKQLYDTQAWKDLTLHYNQDLKANSITALFEDDPKRGDRLTISARGIYFDYSKNILNDTTLSLFHKLIETSELKQKIHDMFSGKKINSTEDRAVLHVAQRAPKHEKIFCDGENIVPQVHRVLEQMREFTDKVQSGSWLGYSGKQITDIVHIGIGGAEIGPHMACEALSDFFHPRLKAHFVSNVDPANFVDATRNLDPEQTMFILSSKSFTTTETLTNAHAARQWFLQTANDETAIAKHFVAISTNTDAAIAFGIDPVNMFEMWDWVGGRYSLMGATGLIVMLMIGYEHFMELLRGARSIDEHFMTEETAQNIPIMMAVISILYNNFFGAETELITPYSSRLDRFTTYMQQANMESNGKSITLDGEVVVTKTGPIVWGKPGTDSQHTFMQHVHQSKRLIPTDIIVFKHATQDMHNQHMMLVANALAQSEALAFGKDDDALRAEGVPETLIPHKRMPGNIPNNFLLFESLNPYTLGQLIALYEHKIFVQGALWNINSFDQWGVQLGKVLAKNIISELENSARHNHDSSTEELLRRTKVSPK